MSLFGHFIALPLVAAAPSAFPPHRSADSVLARLTAEALAANRGLEAVAAMARGASLRVRPAGALPDPMLTGGVMDLVLPRFAFRRSEFTEVYFEAAQEFPWPGTLRARTDGAAATAAAMAAERSALGRDVATLVARAYHRLRYVVSARTTLARQRALLQAAVDISTARYATGSAPQSDPLQARVARGRLDAEETMLVEEETSLRAELGALRNVTTPESLAVEPIEPALDQLVPLHAAARALDSAGTLATHPRLAARRGALEAARATIRVEALAARPDLTVGARYATRPIASDFFSIALGVRLPVWAGRKQHRLADAARQETAAAEAALAEEERRLEAELRSVRVSVAAGRQRIELLATQVVPSAHETAHAALRSYRVGQVDFLSYLAAEDSRYRAELEVASATADHLTHLVMLEQLLGPEVEP